MTKRYCKRCKRNEFLSEGFWLGKVQDENGDDLFILSTCPLCEWPEKPEKEKTDDSI